MIGVLTIVTLLVVIVIGGVVFTAFHPNLQRWGDAQKNNPVRNIDV